ncbi:MAG TPA: DNA polymerase ligase N-terminal domain-containing protein [Rhabdochlamydiaceae bacterium]|nr:DNA polymerase ligase N-terminal domain-containing protein [Rhabdochlamydiaceae bacterium]
MALKLLAYRKKRNFKKTPEPSGTKKRAVKKPLFVVQKHYASHLHYDFRLEMEGVLKSWAVPKGIPTKTAEKRLAIETEDHPLEYAYFKGVIPEGQYGAGRVEIWDRGTFINLKEIPLKKSYRNGRMELELKGKKLKGAFALIHFREKQWLLIKMKKRSLEG